MSLPCGLNVMDSWNCDFQPTLAIPRVASNTSQTTCVPVSLAILAATFGDISFSLYETREGGKGVHSIWITAPTAV
jgi:hypothetical protein